MPTESRLVRQTPSLDGSLRPAQTNSPWKPFVKWAIRLSVVAIVVWGVWGNVAKALREIERREFSLSQLDFGWLLVAAVAYMLGMIPGWIYWLQTLRAMGQRPETLPSLRAFLIGQLGKYVPGKAMVVVLRTALIRGPRVNGAIAAASVFVETLTMMAVGAAIAAIIVVLYYREHWQLAALAVGLMLAAGIPTLPPIFRRVVRLIAKKWSGPGLDAALEGVTFRLVGAGWALMPWLWLLYAVSLWATLQATTLTVVTPGDFPLLLASVSLAMVAGFLSLLPGGVGVREAVVMALLAPRFGELAAVIAAVLLRLVWLVAEVGVSAILWKAGGQRASVAAVEMPAEMPAEPPAVG